MKVFNILLSLVLAIVVGAAFLSVGTHREARLNRQLIEEQNRTLARLDEQTAKITQRIDEISRENETLIADFSLGPRLWNEYRKGVCLISGTYVFIDAISGRPWRLPAKPTNQTGELSPRAKLQGSFTTEGDGELAQVDYVGTGFHVGGGYILTNRHIALDPWKYDVLTPIIGGLVRGEPHLATLQAYFPGQRRFYPLITKLASSDEDVAVCLLNVKQIPADIPILPLDRNPSSVAVGQAVITIGYSGGAERLLALLPEAQVKDLRARYVDAEPSLIRHLAKRGLMQPLSSQGHLMDLTEKKIFYDATTGGGGSGSPVFGRSGGVIGIHYGYHPQNRVTNAAVRIETAQALLQRAGWKPLQLLLRLEP